MKKPPYLQKRDTIALIATARKVVKKEIDFSISLLESWDLKVVLGENIFKQDHQFAGTIGERRSDLQQALDNKEIKGILCVRGGYGTVQLIDKIDFTSFLQHPKWIIGYSDVTVLHNHINQNFNMPTLHATMPINFSNNTKKSLTSLKNALFGEKITYTIPHNALNKYGESEGILVGGNLSIIYSLTGTPSQITTKNKILFIEDVDEYLYHIDRMLMNLKSAGMLSALAGLIVGGLSDMNDNTIPFGKTAQEIISHHTKEYNYPVCFDFPAGHIADNRALFFGEKVNLTISEATVSVKFI